MRIVGVMFVRNEEDIVEASIRHNLRVLDALTVVDHASSDATPAILASLAKEGLPLEVTRDDSLGFLQSDLTTTQVRRLLLDGADLCIPVDADEFVCMPSREAFEHSVSNADPAVHLALPWLTYLPSFEAPGDIVARLRHAKRKETELHGLYKVAVRRSLLDTPGAFVGHGNHNVLPDAATHAAPHVMIHGSLAAIAHVPVRGVEQFTAKVAVGYLSRLLARPDAPTSFHFREEYASIMAGKPPSRERLESIVANYSVHPAQRTASAPPAWLEDPFLAPIELRYTPTRPPAPLAQVLAFGERVAAEIAQTTGGL